MTKSAKKAIVGKRGDYGFNGYIASKGIGKREIRVLNVTLKMSIIATADNEARSRRAFYPVVTTSSSFDMTLAFLSWEEREKFNSWLTGYLTSLSRGLAKAGTMTVSVPSRNIFNTCIPNGDIEFGEGVKDVGYYMRVPFSGASDPVDNLKDPDRLISKFQQAKVGSATSNHFYPQGVQVSGAPNLDGTFFDPNTPFDPYDPDVYEDPSPPVEDAPDGYPQNNSPTYLP